MRLNPRLAVQFATTAFLGAALVSCSGTADGNPLPGSSSPPQTPASSGNHRSGHAPAVTDPVDLSKIKTDPCSALASQQRQKLKLKDGHVTQDDSNCAYDYANVVGNRVNIKHIDKFNNGLADVYARKNALGYFEPTQVAGYPAVYAGKYDDRDSGLCTLIVGLTNDDVIEIFAQLSGGTDYDRPCEVAELTAKTMIENVKDGS